MNEIANELKLLRADVNGLKKLTENVTGAPVIRSHSGVAFDLNDGLDVLQMKKWIKSIDRRIDLLDERVDGVEKDMEVTG